MYTFVVNLTYDTKYDIYTVFTHINYLKPLRSHGYFLTVSIGKPSVHEVYGKCATYDKHPMYNPLKPAQSKQPHTNGTIYSKHVR